MTTYFSRNDAYLSKRAKCPDCSMQPFNHWINSPKVAIANSQSVSIAARLQELPSFANLLRENNLNFVLCPPSSAAKNSGVHFAHAQLDIAPWNTAGSERFKRWLRRFTGSESTRNFSTLGPWSNPWLSAILNNVTSHITPEVNMTGSHPFLESVTFALSTLPTMCQRLGYLECFIRCQWYSWH